MTAEFVDLVVIISFRHFRYHMKHAFRYKCDCVYGILLQVLYRVAHDSVAYRLQLSITPLLFLLKRLCCPPVWTVGFVDCCLLRGALSSLTVYVAADLMTYSGCLAVASLT